jgi:hypothetical protein
MKQRQHRSRRDSRVTAGPVATRWAVHRCLMARHWLSERHLGARDRGDVPGWVLVTLMTAGLVVALWATAGPRLEGVFNDAMDQVVGGP